MKGLTVRSARLRAATIVWRWRAVHSGLHREGESRSHSQACSAGLPQTPALPPPPGVPGYTLHAGTKSSNTRDSPKVWI